MIVDGIIRLIVIAFAFFLATMGAAVFFVFASLGLDWFQPLADGSSFHEGPEYWLEFMLRVGLFAGFIATVTGMMAAAPLFLAVILAEVFRVRSLALWGLIGAAIGTTAVILWDNGRGLAGQDEYLIGIGAAIAGALIYWLIAGRNAGRWWEKAQERLGESG